MRPLLVLQHIACEPPAAYEDEMRARGVALQRVALDEGDPLPDWRGYAAIVAMGGPMGAYEEARLPWLAAEKRLIAEAVGAGLPYWGVCLGAQLLAAALGADVYPGHRAEVGVLPVRTTAAAGDDPVFGAAPAEFPALQWHGDTFALPEGATHLAGSDAYAHQAFAVGRAYGLQFHLEVDAAMATAWGEVPAYARSLRDLLGEAGLPTLVGAVSAREAEMIDLARRLFGRWLVDVVGADPQGAGPGEAMTAGAPPASADPAGDAQPL